MDSDLLSDWVTHSEGFQGLCPKRSTECGWRIWHPEVPGRTANHAPGYNLESATTAPVWGNMSPTLRQIAEQDPITQQSFLQALICGFKQILWLPTGSEHTVVAQARKINSAGTRSRCHCLGPQGCGVRPQVAFNLLHKKELTNTEPDGGI